MSLMLGSSFCFKCILVIKLTINGLNSPNTIYCCPAQYICSKMTVTISCCHACCNVAVIAVMTTHLLDQSQLAQLHKTPESTQNLHLLLFPVIWEILDQIPNTWPTKFVKFSSRNSLKVWEEQWKSGTTHWVKFHYNFSVTSVEKGG